MSDMEYGFGKNMHITHTLSHLFQTCGRVKKNFNFMLVSIYDATFIPRTIYE